MQTRKARPCFCVKNTEIPLLLKWNKKAYRFLNKKSCGSTWKRHWGNGLMITKPAITFSRIYFSISKYFGFRSHVNDTENTCWGIRLDSFQYGLLSHPTKALLLHGMDAGGINVLLRIKYGHKKSRIFKSCFWKCVNF